MLGVEAGGVVHVASRAASRSRRSRSSADRWSQAFRAAWASSPGAAGPCSPAPVGYSTASRVATASKPAKFGREALLLRRVPGRLASDGLGLAGHGAFLFRSSSIGGHARLLGACRLERQARLAGGPAVVVTASCSAARFVSARSRSALTRACSERRSRTESAAPNVTPTSSTTAEPSRVTATQPTGNDPLQVETRRQVR